ncbi:MAG: hypothetical protein IT271_06785 [Chitinophagales bacterium]|nr:hypothetical protein [Chitinophagales bacterium]
MKTFRLIIAITVLFVLILACQKQETVSLSGKIKTSKLVLFNGTDSSDYKYNYQYNSEGNLESILMSSDYYASMPVILYQVQYQTDKVILRDSTSLAAVFYLQPGTNLVDSIINFYEGENKNGIKVLRASNNNILRIIPANETEIPLSNYTVDSFVYVGNELKSYTVFFSSFGTSFFVNYELSYNSTQNKRVDNDNFQMDNKAGFFGISSFILNDFGILGISLGNTSTHAISSVKHRDINSLTNTDYTCLENTPGILSVDYVTTPLSGADFIQLRNTYFP